MGTSSILAFDSSSKGSLNFDDESCLSYFLGNVSPLHTSCDLTDWPLTTGKKPNDRSIETDCSPVVLKTSRKRASPRKRKSWGQILPEPTTSLPPRKRAKTREEKEQRRIERVLRNRRAAHFSRERKRQEVESLEAYNKTLERRLFEVTESNAVLVTELRRIQHARGHRSWSLCADESTISPHDRVTLPQDPCEISHSMAASYANDHSTSELPENIGCSSVDPVCLSVSLPVFLGAAMEVNDELTQPSKAHCIEGLEVEKPLNEYDHPSLALAKHGNPSIDLRLDTQDHMSNLVNDFRLCTAPAADSPDSGVDKLASGNALDVSIDSRRDDIAGNVFGFGLTLNDELVVEAAKVVTDILVSRCSAAVDALEPEKQDDSSNTLDLTEQAVLLLSNV